MNSYTNRIDKIVKEYTGDLNKTTQKEKIVEDRIRADLVEGIYADGRS